MHNKYLPILINIFFSFFFIIIIIIIIIIHLFTGNALEISRLAAIQLCKSTKWINK